MALAELLGTFPLQVFMDEYYLKLPFALAEGSRGFGALGTWDVLESIWPQAGVDLIASNQQGLWKGDPPDSNAAARRLLDEGYTLGIRHAQRHHPALEKLAADFAADFLAEIDVHIYCTPGATGGFSWHYDAEEVFVLQTIGSKEWWLRKNTVNPWPLIESLPDDMRYRAEIMPLLRCALKAGDWLYIPSGYWHRTAAGEEAISLSVGIAAPTGISMLDFLRPRLLESLRWRQRLPPAGAAQAAGEQALLEKYIQHFAELGQDLARLLADHATARAFLDGRARDQSRGTPS
jgi:50S ribosomal protein L16 3-hydroxylase